MNNQDTRSISTAFAVYGPPRSWTITSPAPVVLTPLTILDASDDTHRGRTRIVAGTLGNLLPEEMTVPDGVLPDGTDNCCYLTMSDGVNYVYGKVGLDSDTGFFSEAHVYRVDSEEDPDGTWVYVLIGTVLYNASTHELHITQLASGSLGLIVISSADGSLLQGSWGSLL